VSDNSFGPDPERVTDLRSLVDELDLLRRRAARGTRKNRVSLADLGRSADLPRSTVHTYVTGQAFPAIDVLDRLLIALGATADELAAWSDAWFRVAAALGSRRRGPVPTSAVLPRQLPSDVPGFVGRHDQLAALDGLMPTRPLTASTTVVISAIAGTAGVGKTALAVHWAHRVADRFPDGQLYLNLRGYDVESPLSPEDSLGRLLRALGVDVRDLPAPRDERAARFRTEMAGKRILLILDNARSAEQVRDLLPGTGDCLVLITSRDALTGLVARDGARRVDLDLMPLPDAIALLRALIGERVADEPVAAAELAEACARLPLALRVAAEYVRSRPDATIADTVGELRDERRGLEVLDADGDERTAVRSVFSRSYQALPAAQARLFRLLGAHPGTAFDLHAAAALAGHDLATTTHLLDGLAQAHLVMAIEPGRYTMHGLLRSYVLEVSGHQRETDPLLRLVDYYGYAASMAMDTLYPAERDRRPRIPPPDSVAVPALSDPVAARAWLEAERANLLSAVTLAEARGWAQRTGRLAATLWRDLDTGAHNSEALTMHHLALSAAQANEDEVAEADALRNLSTAYSTAGHYADAQGYARRCVALRRKLGDKRGEAAALNSVAIVCGLLGQFDAAVEAYRRSLDIRRETGDRRGEAAVLQNLAVTCMRAERHENVADHLRTALTLFREIGDRPGEGHALNNLGDLHRAERRFEVALDHHLQALAIYRDFGSRDGEADAANGIALDHAAMGQFAEAVPWHEQALDVAESGFQGILIHTHNSFGRTLHALGRNADARDHLETAHQLALSSGDEYEQAHALSGIAETRFDEGDLESAQELWERAFELFSALGIPAAERVRARLTDALVRR